MKSCVVDELRLGSAPDARAFFLLDRQKKEAKEKATPGRRPACGGVPCATRSAGRLRNSDLRPSDSPRRLPPAALRCSASPRGDQHRAGFDAHRAWYPFGFPLALCVVEQRKTQREKGRGLSEGRSPEFRSPPVAAEQRRAPGASRATRRARFLLGYFFLARQEEVRPRVRRGTQRVRMAPIVRKNYVLPAPDSSNNPPHCLYGRMPLSRRLL